MAKVPMAGAVKTRLARDIGVAGAVRFARQTTAALLQRIASDPRWQTTIAVTPDRGVGSRMWPRGLACVGQGAGDLGRRMQRIFDSLPRGPAVIIGTDIPGIRPAHIAEAFLLLGRHDAVLGPTNDGGYWLVGLGRRPRVPRPFAGVRWSGPHALADTVANFRGCSIGFAATLDDVDDARALRADGGSFGRRVRSTVAASRTTPSPVTCSARAARGRNENDPDAPH